MRCEVLAKGEVKTTVPANYNDIDKGVMKIEDLKKSYYAWIGKTVSVKGYYHSYSSSTKKSGKTITIDLKPDKSADIKVGFSMTKGYKPKKIKKRDGVIIKGTVHNVFIGRVQLKDSVLVNR